MAFFKPLANVPANVTFKFDTGFEVEGKFGPQVMCTVLVDGEEMKWYMPMPLHDAVFAGQMRPGRVARILKPERGNMQVEWLDGDEPPPPAVDTTPRGQQAAPAAAPVGRPSNTHSSNRPQNMEEGIQQQFQAIILVQDAAAKYEMDFSLDTIQDIATSVCIELNKHNIPWRIEPDATDAPAAPAPAAPAPANDAVVAQVADTFQGVVEAATVTPTVIEDDGLPF